MCVHYWVIDSSNQGICKKCGKGESFSPPPIKLTKAERAKIKVNTNEYYMQGILRLDRMDEECKIR